jgi:HlyD family secretion protein
MTIFKRFTDNMPKISSMEDSRKTRNVTSDKGTSRVKPMSGAGMDRKVTRKNTWFKKIMLPGLVLLILGYLAYDGLSNSGKKLSVDQGKIQISSVTSGTFEDFIPVRGRVTPAKTLYLDAIEGGRVERILVEDGANLNKGDLIVELSNASLQLSVLGNEARVAEQLNNMRSIELSLEQNRLQHKRNLIDIRYQIKTLTRQLKRESDLMKTGAVSKTQFDDTKDTLEWYQNRLAVTLESQASDQKMQVEQLKFLTETTTRLESNLAISRQNLDNMNVKAPVNGKLSGFDIEVGQSIGRGERLGQIDTPNDFKLTATIDEFYLSRVDIGQKASFDDYELKISKIYPHVQNGQFKIDFAFQGEQPSNIRRGQTVQTKLTLGDATKALLIPNGSFFQDTGGNWIFVVDNDSTQATRRPIKLGRRNSRYIEVLDGLAEGERVVTSPYNGYQEMQILNLNN